MANNENGTNPTNTYNTCTRNQREHNNTTTGGNDGFETLVYITVVVLIICALIIAISLCITFALVGLRIYIMHYS